MYYAIGVIYWFIPYTLLATGIWIWSKNKPVTSMHKLGLLSPVIFSTLMIFEFSIIWLPTAGLKEATSILAMLIIISLFTGYFIVGIALMVSKVLQSKNLISEISPL
jgi:hypothetical protein